MIITNSHYTLVGYFITSYPTRAHGIIVIYPCDGLAFNAGGSGSIPSYFKLYKLGYWFSGTYDTHWVVFYSGNSGCDHLS